MMQQLLTQFAATCGGGSFFGLPRWSKYLDGQLQYRNPNGSFATGPGDLVTEECVPKISGLNDVWLIGASVLEMLLRIAALAAVAMVVWGGIQFISSQGEPEKAAKARHTIINALVGLVIAVGAATLVSFLAGSIN